MKSSAHEGVAGDVSIRISSRASTKAAVALGLVGLLWSSGAVAQVYDVKMTLPKSVQVQDVVLGTANNLRVEAFANVEGARIRAS